MRFSMLPSWFNIFLDKENPRYLPFTTTSVAIAIVLLEEIFLSMPLYKFITDRSGYPPGWTEHFLSAITVILSFYLLICLIWTILISPRPVKIGLILLFSMATLAEYSFYKTMGRFILPADITIGFRTDVGTWRDALHLYFDWGALGVVVFFTLLFSLLSVKSDLRKSWLGILLLFLGVGLINLMPVSNHKNINWGASPVQFSSLLYRYTLDTFFPLKRELLTFQVETTPHNNIVLIIDESVGGEYLGINGFSRDTTPYLAKLAAKKQFFHNWGIAVPSATCSVNSNALLLTGVRVEPGNQEKAYHFPTVYQYAKAMGYKTYYIDAQWTIPWAGITDQDIQFIDHWVKASDLGQDKRQRDFYAADLIHQIVSSSTGNLIVLNKLGIHFFYQNNYSLDHAIWLPIPETEEEYHNSYDLILNDYSNALRFNVDGFFEHLFPNPAQLAEYTKNTYYLYTSDHGQTLFQQNATSLHCGKTPLETRVPLFIIGQFNQQPDIEYWASHSNLLPTILNLMAVPKEKIPFYLNISLLEAQKNDSVDRLFFSGASDEIFDHDKLEHKEHILGSSHQH